ncbi:MAG: hypothetical protein R2788_03910 [Saprospiraceae bacterium]
MKSGKKIGLSHYGSPTLSDQALMNFPTLKIGPGDSARSHTADEFIYLEEIENGMAIYIELLMGMNLTNFVTTWVATDYTDFHRLITHNEFVFSIQSVSLIRENPCNPWQGNP